MSDDQPKEPTHCDAEKAFNDGTYLTATDDELRAWHQACTRAHGPNQPAVNRIMHIGTLIWQELTRRQNQRQAASGAAVSDDSVAQGSNNQIGADTETAAVEWTEARLQDLVSNIVGESLTLEYKRAAALSRDSKLEITKDVSAIANSAGGVLIYGIAEDSKTKQLSLDPVDANAFTREWLQQVVSQVRPRIDGLRIHPVQLSRTGTVYVLEIPEGTTAHQAADFRYYRRYNFECLPMHDHEIRDIMNRTKHPQIEVKAKLIIYSRHTMDGEDGALVLHVENKTDVLAHHYAVAVDAPVRVQGKLVRYKDATIQDHAGVWAYRLNFANYNGVPLFPRSTIRPVFQFSFMDSMRPEPPKEVDQFSVLVFADSMPKRTFVFKPDDILEAKVKPT